MRYHLALLLLSLRVVFAAEPAVPPPHGPARGCEGPYQQALGNAPRDSRVPPEVAAKARAEQTQWTDLNGPEPTAYTEVRTIDRLRLSQPESEDRRLFLRAESLFGTRALKKAPSGSYVTIGRSVEFDRKTSQTVRVDDLRLYTPNKAGTYDVSRVVQNDGVVERSSYKSATAPVFPQPSLSQKAATTGTEPTTQPAADSAANPLCRLFELPDSALSAALTKVTAEGYSAKLAGDYMVVTHPNLKEIVEQGQSSVGPVEKKVIAKWVRGVNADITIDLDETNQRRFFELLAALNRLRGGPMNEFALEKQKEILSYLK